MSSTSDQRETVHHSLQPRFRLAGSSRGPPLGPRKAPEKLTRHHTVDISSLNTSTVVRSALNTNRLQTADSHDMHTRAPPSPAIAGPSKASSTSQPTNSPLYSVSDTLSPTPGHGGSPGCTSLLSAISHSHVGGLALPSRLPPGHPARQFHKLSSTSADGNINDAGSILDFKRLMSKPAVHTTSSSSVISLPSDSELSTPSRHFAQATALSFGLHPGQQDRLSVKPDGRKSVSPTRSASREPPGSYSPGALTSSQPVSQPLELEQSRKPNVLRRRPSTSDAQNPITRPMSSRRRMRSIEGLSTLFTDAGVAQKAPAPRKQSLPSILTPAGQVALAYKQQEQRRKQLEQLSGWSDSSRQSNDGEPSGSTSKAVQEAREVRRGVSLEIAEEEETSGPYYTVFGSSSGHTVSAFNRYVGDFSFPAQAQAEGSSGAGHVKKSRRTLSRKMSGSFKKVADIVKGDREYPGHSRDDSSRGQMPRSQLGLQEERDSSHSRESSTPRSMRTAKNNPPSPHDSERPSRGTPLVDELGAQVKQGHTAAIQNEREDEGAPGGKLWKLVKRISTGGLRDKYRERARESTPPPVPPLPSDLAGAAGKSPFDAWQSPVKDGPGDDAASTRSTPMVSRPSGSGARPSTSSSHKLSSRHAAGSRPSTGGKTPPSPPVPRNSTTTRSSSPISSEPASSGFFHKTHSTRSSASSYGEIPPLPTAQGPNVGNHIIPPRELGRLDTSRAEPKAASSSRRKPVRSASEPPCDPGRCASSADGGIHSLRPPPRRYGTHPQEHSSQERPASPTLPSFSTDDTVNNFSPTSLSPSTLPLSEFGPAPPRPQRSARRKPASIELPTAAAVAAVVDGPPSARTPRTPRPLVKTTLDRLARNRDSISTLHASSSGRTLVVSSSGSSSPVLASAPTSPLSVSSHRSAPLFRELQSPRQAWTEQEKQDKWEALLERSARAGGTLHIGETGLLSENMSVSQYEP